MDEESRHIIKCKSPGLSCCEHRLVATGSIEANVAGHPIWCMKWRESRMKDKIFRACDAEYKVKDAGS